MLASVTMPQWAWVVAAIGVVIFAYIVLRPSAPSPKLDKLAQTVLRQNNMQAYWKVPGVTSYPIPIEGGVIHKITDYQAQQISTQLQATVPAAEMPVLCGLFASESVMDPQCQNGNWNGSNPSKSLWGYDCGLPQLKLCDIEIAGKTGAEAFKTPEDALDFACDVTKAIPYAYGLFQSHLITADEWIKGNTNSAIDARLMNRAILAALIYKRGAGEGTVEVPGALRIFQSGTWPAELNNFGNLTVWYANALGIPSVI